MILFKLGGSLITNKSGDREIDLKRIEAYAREIDNIRGRLIGNSVAVLGGGSFGNRTILDFGLNNMEGAEAGQRSLMTETMLDYSLQVLRVLHEQGIPVFPVQVAPFFSDPYGPRLLAKALQGIVNDGILPVLTGDYVREPSGKWRVVSSDELLLVLARYLRPELVIALTDVPGVMDLDTGRTLPRICRENAEAALGLTSGSTKPDATGGMRYKLQCLLQIAGMGIDSVIVDGRNASALTSIFTGSNDVPIHGRTVVKGWNTTTSILC
jgi:isopentenyl phosphate kinase